MMDWKSYMMLYIFCNISLLQFTQVKQRMWQIQSFLLLLSIHLSVQEGCLINILELPTPQPLVLSAYTHQFFYPTAFETLDRKINISQGDSIIITCPGGHLNLNERPAFAYAHCNTKDQLVVNEEVLVFQGLSCDNDYTLSSYKITNETCANNASNKIVEIGFEVGQNVHFVPVATVCFDFVNKAAVYSNFTLSRSIGLSYVEPVQNLIHESIFYNLSRSLLEIYDSNYAVATLNGLLGSNNRSYPYFREFLINIEELFYPPQKHAVFRDILTWPQWRGCYASDQIHRSTVWYAEDKHLDLVVYTGSLGVSQLPHSTTGKPVDIYLYANGTTRAIPVPVLMWRLIYEPISRKAVVLSSIDNENLLNAKQFVLCNDISQSIKWLLWTFDCGISYACSYQDFKKVVPYLPDLDVTGVLY